MDGVKRGLSAGDRARLLVLLKADVEDKARDLRDAGWVEYGNGVWRREVNGRAYALHDAHALAMGREA